MSKYRELTISILGGGGEIGANTIEVCYGSEGILLDCGIHPKKEGYEALPEFDMMSRFPDAVLVTHGHIDHCGGLPYLTRLFSHFRVHATLPTIRIMERMLHNSVVVMSTLRRERGIVEYPLYNHEDVENLIEVTRAHLYKEIFEVSPHGVIKAMFNPAGHVLGSASILLDIEGHKILYTGDISGGYQELLGPYEPIEWLDCVDTMIVECTQGAVDERQVNPYFDEALNLAGAINEVIDRSGSVLIPTFALGRTQEIANILARLQEEGVLKKVPIYLSGLGRAIYEIYEQFKEYLNEKSILRPLRSFRKLGNVLDKNVVNQLIGEPSIIIATSGMMVENTPSALIAERMVMSKHHGIFFVGYVDPDTLGYRLLTSEEGDKLAFQLDAEPVEVKLRNIRRFHFSGHAYRSALVKLIESYNPENVIVVHGDPPALEWMREHLKDNYNCIVPGNGEKISFQV
ncbi:MAG: MBL fold metallo-hydrolase [Candidatus Hydrogenedentes bacterium]|nr:MBL fold metallo-hydrolase [Candidatus Hydrogenedentota bacterium]